MNAPIAAIYPKTAELAQHLKAAADPLRLEILRVLAMDSFAVLELCHLFQIKQSGMSHHLKVLARANLVSTRKEGNSVFYRRNHLPPNADHHPLQEALYQAVDNLPLNTVQTKRIDEIHQQRSRASQEFFAEHAEAFKAKQDLIADHSVYTGPVLEILDNSASPSRLNVLEIGPGEGEFLPFLSARFEQVTALDNSAAMLTKAQSLARHEALGNIKFVHGDTRYCQRIPAYFDCAVINMVLHHTPSPVQIFKDIRTALRPAGVLLICDLCHHNQDWVQQACGDLWLGFDPVDLLRWGNECGFREGLSTYIALRNGFQIQTRQFIKESP